MFSKFKSSGSSSSHNQTQGNFESNPISQYFEIGKAFANSGPELIWKIHTAFRKSDGKECSVFIFEKRIAEKLHKPKRKDIVTEILRNSIKQLERFRHPRILHVLHTVEECQDTLAFATEPLLASLANILAYQHETLISNNLQTSNSLNNSSTVITSTSKLPFSIEYNFLDIEIKYGLLQITEALSYLHYNGHIIHRNICPASVLVNKKGIWKLFGFEFTEPVKDNDGIEPITCQSWSSRISKMMQPQLDFIAPETQLSSICSVLSDMYSLGMLICTIFNHGRPLIQAHYSPSNYLKQIETLDNHIENLLPRIPLPLHEATVRLLSRDIRQRPTSQLLALIKYFSESTVNALQFLDVINMKDPPQKANFYRTTLKEVLPLIPKKLWFQHVWPCLQQEIRSQEVLAAVLQPVIFLIQECTIDEYENCLLPSFKLVFSMPKSVQALVTLLENLHIILEKSPYNEIRTEVLPLLFSSFDSATIQVQNAALLAISNVPEYIDETAAQRIVLPKIQKIYERNINDYKIISAILLAIERILSKLNKSQITDDILPLIWDIRLIDSEIITRVLNIYRLLLTDKKFGISIKLIANRIMPCLVPQTVNPSLNLDQFSLLIEVLHEMLEQIDKNQRNKLKLDTMSKSSSDFNNQHVPLRHQYSTENMNVQPFNIPNLRIERRKTSSAEDMARKSSNSGLLGSWWFSHSPSSPDSNFLRVLNAFPNRRLSDNTLMTPKIRVGSTGTVSSCDNASVGLPLRRHSSIGPQERRGSTINLSPPPKMKKYLRFVGFIWFLVFVPSYIEATNDTESNFNNPMSLIELEHLRNESRDMFYHAYNSYLKFAYPADELMPLSCIGRYRNYENSRGDIDDVLGNYSLTLIDSLDTLAILGDFEEFEKAIKLVINDVSFDKDIIVSVFETNIRILGGLLSAHVISKYIQKKFGGLIWYKNELLDMSVDLGFRLLPAFKTSTGIPHGKVNLKYGMNDTQLINSRETCTACAGSMILEMAALSRLSHISIFEEKSHQVMDKLWSLRHRATDLMGTVLNVHSGDWTQKDSGVGAGIDSYYEYLLKAYILLGEDHYYDRFLQHYNAIMKYISQHYMLVHVHMHRPSIRTRSYMDALQAFWPGLQVLNGDLKPAIETHEIYFQVVRRHNFIPEAFTSDLKVYWNQHLLRPEFLESTYFLYQATRDPYYLHVGKTVLEALQKYSRVPCGYAAVSDVVTGEKEDRMDSFVLSETFKYLYLLFSEPKHLGIDLNEFLFTTEAHLLPLNLAAINKHGKSFSNYTNTSAFESKMCPHNANIRSIRKSIQKSVETSTKNRASDSDVPIKVISVNSLDMNNSEHIQLLKYMGIHVWMDPAGNVQFVHLPSLAKSNNYAIEGEKFMREITEATKIVSKIHLINHVSFYDPKNNNNTLIQFNASGADFVWKNVSDVSAKIAFVEPEDACDTCSNPEQVLGKIAIVKRGLCTFVQKAKLMESFGVKGLIIVDDQKNSSALKSFLFTMSGDGNRTVNMPVVFLYDSDAQILIEALKLEPNLLVNITKWRNTENNIRESNADELITLKQDVKIEIRLKDILWSSDINNSTNMMHLDKEYFNISSKIIIYQFTRNNISYLNFDFRDKNSVHRLFSFNYISMPFVIRTNLFLETFSNNSNVDNLFNVIENFVHLFQRPEIVYKMKLLNILKALSFLSKLKKDHQFKNDFSELKMTENEDFTYETNEIHVSKIDTFHNFEIKVPEYECLSFFIHFKEIDTSLNNFSQYLPQILKLDKDLYFTEIFPLHVEEFYRMISFRNYIMQVLDTLRRYNSKSSCKNRHSDVVKDEL